MLDLTMTISADPSKSKAELKSVETRGRPTSIAKIVKSLRKRPKRKAKK